MRQRREALGLTQEQVGLREGLQMAYVSRVELGQINVSLSTLHRLARALETPAWMLLRDAEAYSERLC